MISVIIPVYNAAPYLDQCLSSLCGQDFDDIEIICVDDGSTDGSAGILSGYTLRDGRVKVITQPNGGIASARNRGMEASCGEWLMFVDADDWTDARTCSTALQHAAGTGADVVFWPYVREFGNDRRSPRFLLNEDSVFEGEALRLLHRKIVGPVREELRDPSLLHSWGTVWGKLYKREVIGGTKFTDTRIVGSAEDVLFNIEVFTRVRKAIYLNTPMYHYRKSQGSFTGGYNGALNDRWETLYSIMEELIDSGALPADFKLALNNRVALGIIGQGLNECRSPRGIRGKIKMLEQIVSGRRYSQAAAGLTLDHFPIHWRLFFRAAKRKNAATLYILLRIMAKIK